MFVLCCHNLYYVVRLCHERRVLIISSVVLCCRALIINSFVLCCAVLLSDFEKMMLYHIDRSARQALDLYNNTEGVSQPSRFQDVKQFCNHTARRQCMHGRMQVHGMKAGVQDAHMAQLSSRWVSQVATSNTGHSEAAD